MKLNKLLICIFAVLAVINPAAANMMLMLDTDTTPQYFVANNASNDFNADSSIVQWIGTQGGWTIGNLWARDESSPYADSYHFDNVSFSSITGGTLTVAFGINNLSRDPSTYMFGFGGLTSGNITFEIYANTDNLMFGKDPANLIYSSGAMTGEGPFGILGGGTSGTLDFGLTNDQLYAMTIFATITHDAGGTTSFNSQFSIPEPGTLVLLGLGLLSLGFSNKKLKK